MMVVLRKRDSVCLGRRKKTESENRSDAFLGLLRPR